MKVYVTATELKKHLSKYILLAAMQDIYVTKNGKVVLKLTNPNKDKEAIAKSLFGVIPNDANLEEEKQKRKSRI